MCVRHAERVPEKPRDLDLAAVGALFGDPARAAMLVALADSRALPADEWPAGVPAQIHYTRADPFRNQAGIDAVTAQVCCAGASIEIFDYPGDGHLFTDASLPREYDVQATTLLWSRVLPFCAAPPQ